MNKLLTIVVLAFHFSAVQAKKDQFKQHAEHIKALETVYVVTDTTIFEPVDKERSGLHLPFNQQIGQNMFANLEEMLAKRINSRFTHALSAVGLYQKENVYTIDVEDINQHIIFPVLDEGVDYSESLNFKTHLDYIMGRTYAWPRTRKELKQYRSRMLEENYSAVNELNLSENEAVLILITTGSKVPTKKAVGEAVASTILTLGLFTRHSVSANQLNAALISHDGQLLWTNSYFLKSKIHTDFKQEAFLRRLFKTFPIKKQPRSR